MKISLFPKRDLDAIVVYRSLTAGVSTEQGLEWAAESTRALWPIARELDIVLALENHYKDGCAGSVLLWIDEGHRPQTRPRPRTGTNHGAPRSSRMKALVKYAFSSGAVEVREIAEPSAGPGEVLIATRAVGVCGSDVHAWRDKQSWEMDLPVALGHEIAGIIDSVGDGVADWSVGDRVVCETAAQICGKCAYCGSGRYNLCWPRR
jgi:hypothetical protein